MHVHLVNYQVVSRTGGSRGVLPYETAGLKDVVLLDPGESVQIRALYGPWNGMYAFHCKLIDLPLRSPPRLIHHIGHNLIHEDSMMMDVFNATRLQELGYKDTSIFSLGDPTDPRFAARDYSAAAYEPAAIKSMIHSLGSMNAYAQASSLFAAEAAYYSTAEYPTPSATVNTAEPTGYGGQPGGRRPYSGAYRARAIPAPTGL